MSAEKAYLYLEDGSCFSGYGFGSKKVNVGELVFTTAMNGYPESLTDPSYAGQMLMITHPLVGNYGVPSKIEKNGILSNFESERIQAEGLIISELTHSQKWNSSMDLDKWLENEEKPGIFGIDTRYLTQKVRNQGAMMCAISIGEELKNPKEVLSKKYTEINYVARVSPKNPIEHKSSGKTIVVVDCGIKHGILQHLAELNYNLIRVPYDYSADKIMQYAPDGIVYSNGPGNPNLLKEVVKSFRDLQEYKVPILGICLGHQIAALAFGGAVNKMKFGHRAINKAVVDLISKNAYITTHNHGYAIHPKDMPKSGKIWLMSPDDDVVEGAIYESQKVITTQFHPEARPGTNDAAFVFKTFDKMVNDA